MRDLQRPRLFLWTAALAAPLLAASRAAADPPMRRVVTDLRVSSTRIEEVLDSNVIADLRKRVAAAIADAGRQRYGYLEWVPLPATGAGGAPLFVQEVFQEAPSPESLCSAKVRWRLVGEKDGARAVFATGDLDNGCNPRPRFRNSSDLENDLKGALASLLEDQWKKIHSDFLRNVPLASRLDTDPANQKVLLPLNRAQLLASNDSRLKVDFVVDQDRGNMKVQPLQPAGDRTQVQIYLLDCGNIASCSELVNEAGSRWVPNLPDLLGRCTKLAVFMETYEPDFAATRGNLRTNLGGEQ